MNFKKARAASGLTQEAAGQLIGATRRAVQEWEGGRRNCPPAKLAYFLMLTMPSPASNVGQHQSAPQSTHGPHPHP